MKIDIKVPNGESGDWAVDEFTVKDRELSQMISMFKTGRGVPAGTYKRLKRYGSVVMSNTPDEIADFRYFLRNAKGNVLINGLGIGVLVAALLNKEDVTDITIIELSVDVIKLSAPTYNKDPRITIINADCFEWQPPKGKRYDAVWHDIWDDITSDNLEEMKRLHRKYGRKCDYQASWCRWRCEKALKDEKRYSYF